MGWRCLKERCMEKAFRAVCQAVESPWRKGQWWYGRTRRVEGAQALTSICSGTSMSKRWRMEPAVQRARTADGRMPSRAAMVGMAAPQSKVSSEPNTTTEKVTRRATFPPGRRGGGGGSGEGGGKGGGAGGAGGVGGGRGGAGVEGGGGGWLGGAGGDGAGPDCKKLVSVTLEVPPRRSKHNTIASRRDSACASMYASVGSPAARALAM